MSSTMSVKRVLVPEIRSAYVTHERALYFSVIGDVFLQDLARWEFLLAMLALVEILRVMR